VLSLEIQNSKLKIQWLSPELRMPGHPQPKLAKIFVSIHISLIPKPEDLAGHNFGVRGSVKYLWIYERLIQIFLKNVFFISNSESQVPSAR
jgi:hypothetical protein